MMVVSSPACPHAHQAKRKDSFPSLLKDASCIMHMLTKYLTGLSLASAATGPYLKVNGNEPIPQGYDIISCEEALLHAVSRPLPTPLRDAEGLLSSL